jgi:hypothetical protein
MKRVGRLLVSVVTSLALSVSTMVALTSGHAMAATSISRAQFDAIKSPMTKAELEAIVGPLGDPQPVTPRYENCHNSSVRTYSGYLFTGSESEFGGADIVISVSVNDGVWDGWNLSTVIHYPFCATNLVNNGVATEASVTIYDDIWRGASREKIVVPRQVWDGTWEDVTYIAADTSKLKKLDTRLASRASFVRVMCGVWFACKGSSVMEELLLGGTDSQLADLRIEGTNLPQLNLSGATRLNNLDIRNNSTLTSLNLSRNTKLRQVYVPENHLTSLTFASPQLERIQAWGNKLTSINLGQCVNLTLLQISKNRLSKLNVAKCKKLRSLSVEKNRLTRIFLAKNSKLAVVAAQNNKGLKRANYSHQPRLRYLAWSYTLPKKWLPKRLKHKKPHKVSKYAYVYR